MTRGLPNQVTWEPRSSLLREIPDVFRAYKLTESSYPNVPANVNVLVVIEHDIVMHGVDNENDVETYNIVVNGYYNDCESDTVVIGARR